MALISSNIARIPASSSGFRTQSSLAVTSVTHRLRFPGPSPSLSTANVFSLPKEPEDARLTGGTRSLERRLLGLNLTHFVKVRPVRSVPAPERMAFPLRPTAA